MFQDRLSLRPPLRYQLVHSDFGADPTFGVVRLNTARDAQEDSVSPSLGVKYTLTSDLALKGNIGRLRVCRLSLSCLETTAPPWGILS